MQAVFNHIETIKLKPHRVRKQFAFAYAAAVAGMIGIIWLGANLASGSFAIRDGDFGASVATTPATVPASAGLAGVAGAGNENSGPARIEIVDTPKPAPKAEPTTIPF